MKNKVSRLLQNYQFHRRASKGSNEIDECLPEYQNRLQECPRISKTRTNKLNNFKENANEQLKKGIQVCRGRGTK